MENKAEIMQHVLQMQSVSLLLNIKWMSGVLSYVCLHMGIWAV